ncbi:hypothetical protein [Sinorhizobium fredii]|uniref:hypothetical protein n=1 Tax=Rhizobium fredii TaxID=380 RepID=UPI0035158D06
MSEINQTNFNVFKAKAISRGKLLERFRCHLQEVVDHVANEGDRVYFGSTNHFDFLKDVVDEMDMWKWDRIIKERPEIDPYAELRALRPRLEALTEALRECEEFFDDRADAEYFTDSAAPHPNEEMKLLTLVRDAIRKAGA